MNRRKFFENSVYGLTPLLFSSAYSNLFARANRTNPYRPNFVVFTCDDAGWSDFGYHGSAIKTPNIDRLAATGVELDQFYAYPLCSPTRAAFMTGKPPSRSGFTEALDFTTEQALPRDTVTIAEMLKRSGYDTALTGKWHLGNKPDVGPNTYGFNHSYGHLTAWINFYTHRSRDDMRSWHRNGTYIHEEGHATDLIAKEAIRFIKEIRDKSKPFFLVVHFNAPHLPLQEEQWRVEQYRGVIETESRQYYAAALTHLDEALGDILLTLREEKLDENSLVIFFSDNGGEDGGKKGYINPVPVYKATSSTEMYGTNLPLRGWKGQLYEGGIHVPAIMHWPGKLQPCKVANPYIVYDIMPTLGYLAGADITPAMNLEGTNIFPIIMGEASPVERIFYWRRSNLIAVRKGGWKLVHLNGNPEEGKDELFNIGNDPFETHDLSKNHPDKLEELKRELRIQYSKDRIP